MKFFLRGLSLSLLCVLVSCLWKSPASLKSPGTIFIRQEVPGYQAIRTAFLGQKESLISHGVSAYSLHRVLRDSHSFILTLKCSNLEKGVDFFRSLGFMAAMDKAGAGIPVIWYGLDATERKYASQSKMSGGIVIARNEVRDYNFWLRCFQSESHHHPGRKYKNSGYSIHYLPGNPAVVLVVHEASDVSKAPSFMTSAAMNGEMKATGVVGLEIWYGINLEEGVF